MQSPAIARDSSGSLGNSLAAVQAGTPGAADEFVVSYGRWVVRTAAALCRRLGVPEQEHEDVVQETYRRLLDPCLERFGPARGGAKAYVRGVILNAIDFAGRRRRGQFAVAVDDPAEVIDSAWRQGFSQVEEYADLLKLLRSADDIARRGVVLVCGGLSQRDAAREMGVSEFKLSRSIGKFTAFARMAA